MADEEFWSNINKLTAMIKADQEHTPNSVDLNDPKLAVLLDALLERQLIDPTAMLLEKLFPDKKQYEEQCRAHLLAKTALWARNFNQELLNLLQTPDLGLKSSALVDKPRRKAAKR